jgi:membrane fusion protein, heavy metal efflux system
MTNTTVTPSPAAGSPEAHAPETPWARWWFRLQYTASLVIAAAVVFYLAFMPHAEQHEPDAETPQPVLSVYPVAHGRIHVDPASSLAKKLQVQAVRTTQIRAPELRVTGTVTASLRPIGENNSDQWQFHDPEILATFHDWRGSEVEVAFHTEQIQQIQQLNETRQTAQRSIVGRLERLVRAGTDTVADLEQARALLLEQEIEGRQALYTAETDLRRAERSAAVLSRRLQLAGFEPSMLLEATSDVDIVVADVPEESQARVRVGQQVEAEFFGLRGQIFPGFVRNIAPVLSPERRSLRVLFFVDDPDDKLRPGMFADIGLGTEPRESVVVPGTAVLHVGRDDFVIARNGADGSEWRVALVELGDTRGSEVEVLSGLRGGEEIVTENAILLKPVAAASLRVPREVTPLSGRLPVQESLRIWPITTSNASAVEERNPLR